MPLVNELIGNFGKYHLWLCFIIFVSKFGVAFQQMAIIFLAPPARYRCPANSTCCEDPEYDKTVFTRTMITEWNLICQSAWLSDLHQMIFQLGVLSGSLLFGIASDKYGRKPTLICAVILEVFSGIMASFLPDFWSFTVMRTIVGFAVGGVMVIGFVVVMEYVGNVYRDVVSVMFHVPFTLGHMFLALLGYLIRDYIYLQLAMSLCNVVLLFYICLLPESPRWLLAANKTVKAIELMERVAKINSLPTEDIRHKMELDQINNIHTRNKKGNVVDLFRTPHIRRNMLVMSFLWLSCSYCFYGMAHYISHLTGNVFVNVVACGSVCLLGCFLSIPMIRFLQRKTVVVVSNALSSVSFLVIMFIPQGTWSTVVGCFGCLCNYMTFVVIYLYTSELFPTVVRNAAIGITSMMARLGAMVAPFVAALRPHGKWCAPAAFGIMPLIAALLCLLLPETKNCELMMTIQEGEEFGTVRPRRPSNNDVLYESLASVLRVLICKGDVRLHTPSGSVAGRHTMAIGLFLAIAWNYTILCGFYILFCPVSYLMFVNHKLYRKVVDCLFALWELYPVALFQCCCGTEVHHFGDYVNRDENTILILNHRTRVDWNYVWIALYHASQDPNAGNHCICRDSATELNREPESMLDLGGKSKIKIVLKDEIKFAPCLGWIMQLNNFLFVKRNWQEDEVSVSEFVDYYKKLRYNCRVVLFPEGTDLSEDNRRKSDKFAAARKLPCYEYVLHPRTTGWSVLCSKLRGARLAAVYDVTLAYDKPAQTELDLLKGRIPRNVYFYFKRYPIGQLPIEEEDLRTWLNDRWLEKENCLRKFHSDGNFIDPVSNKIPIYRTPRSFLVAKFAFIFWTAIDILFTYFIITSKLFQYWVLYHTLLFTFVTWCFGGFHNIQLKLSERVEKICK